MARARELCPAKTPCILPVHQKAYAAERAGPEAFKGVELYSWKTEAGDLRYALLPGTNREKGEDEVKESGHHLKDITALTKALAALPQGESVLWMNCKASTSHREVAGEACTVGDKLRTRIDRDRLDQKC